MKNKKILIISLAVILIFLISAFILFSHQNDKNTLPVKQKQATISEKKKTEKPVSTEEIKSNFQKKLANINKKIEEKNKKYLLNKKEEKTIFPVIYPLKKEYCDQVISVKLKKECNIFLKFNNIVKGLDIKQCQQLNEQDLIDKCIYDINTIKADNWKNCSAIKNQVYYDACLSSYAIKDENVNLCSQMKHKDESCRDRIESFSAKNLLDCTKIKKGEYFMMCLANFQEECAVIKDQYEQKRCESERLIYGILNQGEKNDCMALPLEKYKKVCELFFDNNKKHIDSDGDGMDNGLELFEGTDPFKADIDKKNDEKYWSEMLNNSYYTIAKNIKEIITDTDDDGLRDYEEKNIYHTNYKIQDTDGDGYLDGEEVKNGFNPNGDGELNK